MISPLQVRSAICVIFSIDKVISLFLKVLSNYSVYQGLENLLQKSITYLPVFTVTNLKEWKGR